MSSVKCTVFEVYHTGLGMSFKGHLHEWVWASEWGSCDLWNGTFNPLRCAFHTTMALFPAEIPWRRFAERKKRLLV